MKGKYERKNDHTDQKYKMILCAVAILRLINEVVKLLKNIFD